MREPHLIAKRNKLEAYLNSQKALRSEIEELERHRVEQRINLITKHGGAGSDHFWRIRKKILNHNKENNHDLISEEGNKITDSQKAKEYIADYYEKLYKARPGIPEYKAWTDHITNFVKKPRGKSTCK